MVAYYLVPQLPVVAVFSQAVELHDVVYCSFICLLVSSVETCSLINDISAYFEEVIEFL